MSGVIGHTTSGTRYACGECGKPIKTGCYCRECAERESQADKAAELTKDARTDDEVTK